MGKAYPPDELASRLFFISMAGIGAFCVAVLLFVL